MLRRAVAVALVPLGLQVAVPGAAPQASAASSVLCTGFTQCASSGYSDSGYHAHWGHMYWRMYSGRNCVNYVAYRVVAGGLPDVRPWSGSGNATNWGYAMSSITDRTPVVGAIAWWRANAPGAGSLGHVAYVERVVSPTELIVSESNYGSDFDWRVVTSGSWPTGFIHFRDAVLRNTARPILRGPARVRGGFTVTPGSWAPTTATLGYQWLSDGEPIAGYTGTTFNPSRAYLGKKITVRVTASAAGYKTTSVVSNSSLPLAPGLLGKLLDPVIKGTPEVDEPLTVGGAVFKPGVGSKRVQWYADGEPIEGATASAFTPGQDQIGKTITASITGSRVGFEDLALTAAPTGPVTAEEFEVATPGSATGTPRTGQVLRADPGDFTPSDATVSYQWLQDGVPIDAATRATYAVRSADVGHHLAVQVLLQHPNYRDHLATYEADGVVTTTPTLHVRTTGLAGAARVHVLVTAPGVGRATGTVTILVGKHTMTASLVNGVTTVRVNGLFRGSRRVKVAYAGTSEVLSARQVTAVTVLPVVRAGHGR